MNRSLILIAIGSLKRWLIFAALMPLIAYLVFLCFLYGVDFAEGRRPAFGFPDFGLLPHAYVIVTLPALFVATLDWALSLIRFRALWVALFAYAISYLPVIDMLQHLPPWWIVFFGLFGAIPAAICSWMSGPKPMET